jgi:hypothetical protein
MLFETCATRGGLKSTTANSRHVYARLTEWRCGDGAPISSKARDKSKSFLVLFFKKELLPCPGSASRAQPRARSISRERQNPG